MVENALMFTGLLLLSALVGGLVGAACAKGRQAGDHEGRIAELEDRLDALATHCMDEGKRLRSRISSLANSMDALRPRHAEGAPCKCRPEGEAQ